MAAPKKATTADTNAKALIDKTLAEWGLGGLGTWAWNEYKLTGSMDQTMLLLEDRPEYKARFAGMLAYRKTGGVMDEAGQLAWENNAIQLMRAAGMPKGFYDNWQDFTGLIASGISANELAARVNDAFARAANEPQAVKDALGEYYGANTDQALAAMALDSSKALPIIQRQIAAGEAGGYMKLQGFHLTQTLAERIATATGNSQQQIMQGAQQMGQYGAAGLFEAQAGERQHVPTIEEGLAAVFENNAEEQRTVERTALTRQASTAGGEQVDTSRYGGAGLAEAERGV